MTRYVVELYQPRSGARSPRGDADRLAAGAAELSRRGTPVSYLDAIFLPGDETCLHLFEARTEEDVWAVAERAEIEVERVIPAEQLDRRRSEEPRSPADRTTGVRAGEEER